MAHGTPVDDIESEENDKINKHIYKMSILGGRGPTKHKQLGNILHVLRMYGNKGIHYQLGNKAVKVEMPANARDVLLVVAAMAVRAYTLMLEVFPTSI